MPAFFDGFEIDIAEREQHVFESEIADDIIEEGADVSDHIRNLPTVVTFDGIVSDTPMGGLVERRGLNPDLITPDQILPSDDAFAKFMAIRNARRPITIQTAKRTYTQMALQCLTEPVSSETGDSFTFSVTFKQVRFASNQLTTVKVSTPRARRVVDRGAQPTIVHESVKASADRAKALLGRTGSGLPESQG